MKIGKNIDSHQGATLSSRVVSDKQYLTTAMLSLFLGYVGADRFYVGRYYTATAKLLTLGGLGIWWIIDIVLVYMGKFTDHQGRRLAYRSTYFRSSLAMLGALGVLAIAVPSGNSFIMRPDDTNTARTTTIETGSVGSTLTVNEDDGVVASLEPQQPTVVRTAGQTGARSTTSQAPQSSSQTTAQDPLVPQVTTPQTPAPQTPTPTNPELPVVGEITDPVTETPLIPEVVDVIEVVPEVIEEIPLL